MMEQQQQSLKNQQSQQVTCLGSFTADINNSNAELKVTMNSSGIATVTTKIDTVTV